ncbi:MAG: YggS family pyridoxal phosphate-dependent enzyme [Chloroflexi bacterium]|nr:YggS family pyridoxal phosphate-dependent enzyme [Chloroflexota bacterium]
MALRTGIILDRQQIAATLAQVEERIAAACLRAGRERGEITLIAITKSFPLEVIREAVSLEITNVGENRVQEAAQKIPALKAEGLLATWHMVGPLQKNKVKKAVELFDWLHSLESGALAKELQKWAGKGEKRWPVLIEVNTSGEEQKHGFFLPLQASSRQRQGFWEAVQQIASLPSLSLQGLMTMAPLDAPGEEARPYFRHLRLLSEELTRRYPQAQHLSMGMTDDFEVAVEEGATMLRIGRALFGERPEK